MVYIISLLERILWGCGLIFTGYMVYYIFFLPFAFRKKPKYPVCPPKCRFAVLVAARNEQAVIGHLVESLLAQDYPRHLYDVFVIPNNCTDQTEQVAKEAGAKILHCKHPVRTKGEVLHQIIDSLLPAHEYDAICVFDADNVVEAQFLREMNHAWCNGAKAAQGFRDSKNPYDTYISSDYSIYYWMVNRFYSHARSGVGLSAIINGSGFMADLSLLEQMGGWNTKTLTEDIEFTTKCILSHTPVCWVPAARTYDEQPLTFKQSWHQRSRWSTGIYQCLYHYCLPLLTGMFTNGIHGLRMCFDQLIFLLAPILQLMWLLTVILGHILRIMSERDLISIHPPPFFSYFLFAVVLSILGTCVMSFLVMKLEKKSFRGMGIGIASYWFFIISWIPINFVCLFRRTKEWKAIAHTRTVRVQELKE